jgi:hypothetical protein
VTRTGLATVGALLSLAFWAAPAFASTPAEPKQAILFLIDGVSFEQLLTQPTFRELALAGGAALMTTQDHDSELESTARTFKFWESNADAEAPGTPSFVEALVRRGVQVCQIPRPSDTDSASVAERGVAGCPLPNGVPGAPSLLTIIWLPSPGDPDPVGPGKLSASAALKTADSLLLGDLLTESRVQLRVMAAVLRPSLSMNRVGDEVTLLVMAQGTGDELLHREQLLHRTGPMTAVTSDTTRQDGLVSGVDVVPTLLHYFAVPTPSDVIGEPIRFTDAAAPFALHRLHLEQRRTRLPIQFGELAFVVVGAIAATWALIRKSRTGAVPDQARRFMQIMIVFAASLFPALVVAGALPHRTYMWAVPGIVLSMIALTAMALAWRRPGDTFAPFVFLGLCGLTLLIVELAIGGLALRVPLYGGTMFDGARFYGLPNAFLPFLLASALFVAAALDPYRGFVVLIGAGLVAGFPSLGSDVGGAITLFVAAGLWLVLRRRGSEHSSAAARSTFRTSTGEGRYLRIRDLAFVVAVAAAGLAVVLLANRYLPGAPTHATRFVERNAGSAGGVLHVIGDRLSTGFDMIRDVPAAILPLIALVAILVLVIRRMGAVGTGMDVDERWPAFVAVLCVASLVAYFVNDTGAAAADPAMLYAMAGITYPALLSP